MGEVKVFVELTNTVDVDNFQDKIISENQIRNYESEAFIDIGAALSMFPREIIEKINN